MLRWVRLAALVSSLAGGVRPVSALGCLDDSGVPVPWWFVFKANAGLDYAYVDADTPLSGPLRLLGKSLDCAGGRGCALGATLQALIDAAAAGAAARVAWNDELPVAAAADAAAAAADAADAGVDGDGTGLLTSATSGHTKGVIGANASGGCLLSHTLPKFPLLTVPAYAYSGSTIYAQHFFCVSLGVDDVEAAAAGVQHADPHIYGSVVPSGTLASQYPTLTALVAGARTAGSAKVTLRSTAGNVFSYYVKSGTFNGDLWEDVVQPGLGVNMFVETWRRPPVMETYCAPPYAYASINVDTMRYITAEGAEQTYRYTQDHSKLGVAINTTAQSQWLCVADNNRMTSQWARGGGAVCLRHAPLYQAILDMVVSVDGCPGDSSP